MTFGPLETAIVAGGFTLLGVAFGRLWDRWERHRGDVHCQIGRLPRSPDEIKDPPPIEVRWSVEVHFFNEKEVNIGLSGLTIVAVSETGEKLLLDPAKKDYATSTRPRGAINLPPKTWVAVEISGAFFSVSDAQRILANLKAIEVRGKFPDGKPYHKRCLERP